MRTEGWERRLIALIAAAETRAFVWGAHDCMLFAADAVRALTGIDPASPWRGAYDDVRGAWRFRHQAVTTENMVESALRGAGVSFSALASPLMAQRGDLGLIDSGDDSIYGGRAAGVFYGASILVPGAHRLGRHPASMALCAWHIE